MRFLPAALLLFSLASSAQSFSKAQLKLYNRLPDADWFILSLTEREMLSVSLQRLPSKVEKIYRDVWLRWDVIEHAADPGRSTGIILDIDCQNRQTLEKKTLTYDEMRKREIVTETNQLRDWIPESSSERAYETFCSGFDQALIDWKNRPVAKPKVE